MKKEKKLTITFYPDPDTFEGIKNLAKARNVTRNVILREAAREYLITELKKSSKEAAAFKSLIKDSSDNAE